MNEEEKTGRAIAKLLNDSLNGVTPGTLYRLKTARRAALEHYQPAEKIIHAGAGISARGGYHWFSAYAGRLLLTASLLLFLVVHGYWQKYHRIEDKSVIVPSILTNDSPAGSPEIEDITGDNADVTADEEISSRKANDDSDYSDETGAAVARSAVDSDEVTDSPGTVEIQDSGNTVETPYADGNDQTPAAEENADIASDYLQDSEDAIDFYDEENIQDSTNTTDMSDTLTQ